MSFLKRLTQKFNEVCARRLRSAEENFRPEAASFDVLHQIENGGFENAVLFGGALRDDYLRSTGCPVKTNDYDICAELDSSLFEGKTTFAEATAVFERYIREKFGPVKIEEIGINPYGDRKFMGGVTFTDVQGRKIDLHVQDNRHVDDMGRDTLPPGLYKRIRDPGAMIYGNAPINRIAMNSSGQLHYDASFKEHARQRIYMPKKAIPAEWLADNPRLEKLQAKIPGLQYREPPAGKSPVSIVSEWVQPPGRQKSRAVHVPRHRHK